MTLSEFIAFAHRELDDYASGVVDDAKVHINTVEMNSTDWWKDFQVYMAESVAENHGK